MSQTILTPAKQAPAAVDYVRKEVEDLLPRWKLVKDCVAGQRAVKSAKDEYLPKPNASDTSEENKARYSAYLQRAVFYNVTGYTLAGLLGQVFKSDPVIEIPSGMDVLKVDSDGAGVALNQQTQAALSKVLQFARCALLVDYPQRTTAATVAEVKAGRVRPRLILLNPDDVINWRTVTVGGEVLLSLVVIKESYVVSDDGFKEELEVQYRVLRLVENVYTVEIWKPDPQKSGAYIVAETFVPTDSTGKVWPFIPFTFIGSDNNDSAPPQTTPLYDLAELNIAHYRNSADFEECAYMLGQPTPWVSGVTKEWVNDLWKGKLMLGSRAVIPLPKEGAAGLLQMQENSTLGEAMKHKEEQMKALGAKLITPTEGQKTATEANIENTSQTCILAQCANNVSAAYTKGLEWAGKFFGVTGKTEIKLNVDFQAALKSAQDRAQLVAEWQAKAITTEEMRAGLTEAGVATLSFEEYKTKIEEAGPDLGLPTDPNEMTIKKANAEEAVAKAKNALKQGQAK